MWVFFYYVLDEIVLVIGDYGQDWFLVDVDVVVGYLVMVWYQVFGFDWDVVVEVGIE